MILGAFQRTSFADYPKKLTAVVFTRGCNFRCGWCHNPELVLPQMFSSVVPEEELFAFLRKRAGVLDAVTVTGGEPTLYADLPEFLTKIKQLGYAVKLDTQGTNPAMIRDILCRDLADYIAMDVKAPLEQYRKVTGTDRYNDAVAESISLLKESTKQYEFRTTVVRELHTLEDIEAIARWLEGVSRWVLQKFIPTKCIDPAYLDAGTYTDAEFERLRISALRYIQQVEIR